MYIPPQPVTPERIRKMHDEKVSELERQINGILLRAVPGPGKNTEVKLDSDIPETVIQSVLTKYRNAGWRAGIKREASERTDSYCLYFSYKT